jgi:chromosome segregation ATPase
MQVNAKISEEVIADLSSKVNSLQSNVSESTNKHNDYIGGLKNELARLTSELEVYKREKSEIETIRSKANHVDGLISQLNVSRAETQAAQQKLAEVISEYESKLSALEESIVTPAKRNKKVSLNNNTLSIVPKSTETKDGGSF